MTEGVQAATIALCEAAARSGKIQKGSPHAAVSVVDTCMFYRSWTSYIIAMFLKRKSCVGASDLEDQLATFLLASLLTLVVGSQ